MASLCAARSVFRSSPARTVASRLASPLKSTPTPKASPFRGPANKPALSQPSFRRCPVQMSSAVESMMPFHSVTSSALMTSMLSISCGSYGWLLEGNLSLPVFFSLSFFFST
ncbi:hypothetical protein Tsubulata_013578 [Turnera subulata]|uniref:Protein NUCLEAR FUSION DEFECTIVE 6, chloroplastic/mitochondrial-like n=1 Tax=Turnera subulata TaxID=218843 RepID=A0A9Q0EZ30_9ROSI|nr:hypothetical protein Tsubulata_013578 [Turnera subulata]